MKGIIECWIVYRWRLEPVHKCYRVIAVMVSLDCIVITGTNQIKLKKEECNKHINIILLFVYKTIRGFCTIQKSTYTILHLRD